MTRRRRIRPNREHDAQELAHVDSFALAAELVRRGAVQKPISDGRSGFARITLPVLEPDGPRPTKRSECPVERPCPWVCCSAHLWRVDATDRAGRRGDDRAMPPALVSVASSWSCAFDVVEAHPAGLNADDVGEVLGVVGARVGQLERKALAELNAGLRELHGIDSATLEREARLRERREASGAKPESRLTLTPTERRAMSLATGGRREDRAARRARRQQARAAQLAADAGNTGDLPVLADGISTPPTTNENLHA